MKCPIMNLLELRRSVACGRTDGLSLEVASISIILSKALFLPRLMIWCEESEVVFKFSPAGLELASGT